MDLNTHVFMLIVVGGTIVVWSFRKITNSKEDIKEIEYLVFSCIWGIFMVTGHAELVKVLPNNYENWENLVNNPLANGIFYATLGLILGVFSGVVERRLQIKTKFKNLFSALSPSSDYLGTEDVSEKLYKKAEVLVKKEKRASTPFLQRKLKIGYARSAVLMDMLEENGVIGAINSSKEK